MNIKQKEIGEIHYFGHYISFTFKSKITCEYIYIYIYIYTYHSPIYSLSIPAKRAFFLDIFIIGHKKLQNQNTTREWKRKNQSLDAGKTNGTLGGYADFRIDALLS